MIIPKILQKPEFRFCLIKNKSKRPYEKNWTTKGYSFDDEKLQKHLKQGGNYGIICGGKKHLIVIDFDNEEIQNKIISKLPKTSTTKAGGGFLHKYVISNKSDSFKILNKNKDTLVDVQGKGKMVVGPGSTHPNGNKYEIIDDSEIAFIDYNEIEAILKPYDKKTEKEKVATKINIKDGDFINKLQSAIKIESLLL